MSPRPTLPRKVGGHDPPAPMGALPLVRPTGPLTPVSLGASAVVCRRLTTFVEQRISLAVCVACSLSSDAETELLRMDRVYSETSRRISQLQQQLSQHQPSCSARDGDDDDDD